MGCRGSKPKQKHHLGDNFIVERHKSVEADYKIIKQIGKGSIGIIFLAESRRPKYYTWDLLSQLSTSFRQGGTMDDSSRHGGSRHGGSRHGGSRYGGSFHSSSVFGSNSKVQFAIKEIDAAMVDERAFETLKTEVQVLKKLDHPFIIKFFGTYSAVSPTGDREKLSVVMEYCSGGTLCKHCPYKEETAKVLVANVVEAVLYLHRHKIVHRDLKVRVPIISKECTKAPSWPFSHLENHCVHAVVCVIRAKMSCLRTKREIPTIYDCWISDWRRSFLHRNTFATELGRSIP